MELLNATVGDHYGEVLKGYSQAESDVPTPNTANCIRIAQNLHFSLLSSGAFLQIAPAQSDFQSEIGRLLCNSQ